MKLFDHGTVTPQRVNGEITRIVFRGAGEARFRMQHTRDVDGAPDELGWVDVSAMSSGRIKDPRSTLDGFKGYAGVYGIRGGVLVDRVNGDLEILYRRYIADWLRVVPLEGVPGRGCCNPCGRYHVAIESAAGTPA